MSKERERARLGLANGEEKFLPLRDKGPQKKWVRDYVDARWNFGEFLIPIMFAVIIATFLPSLEAQFIAIVALWAFFLITIIDALVVGAGVRKGLRAKYGEDKVEDGVRWYAAMRALQMRGLRLPKAQVKRGEKTELTTTTHLLQQLSCEERPSVDKPCISLNQGRPLVEERLDVVAVEHSTDTDDAVLARQAVANKLQHPLDRVLRGDPDRPPSPFAKHPSGL